MKGDSLISKFNQGLPIKNNKFDFRNRFVFDRYSIQQIHFLLHINDSLLLF